jgi:hypothetical protein
VAKATLTRAVEPPGTSLYESDFHAWTRQTAARLRARRWEDVDADHAAEEIEDMGKREANEVRSRMRVLLMHLLKWQTQSERRSRSWRATIVTQRQEIDALLRQSPSLRRHAKAELLSDYRDAAERAAVETGLARERFPRPCPYTFEHVLDRGFLPD